MCLVSIQLQNPLYLKRIAIFSKNRESGFSPILKTINICILVGLMAGCAEPLPIPKSFMQPAPREEVPITSRGTLKGFQTAVVNNEKNYRLGAGDEITIEVWGYPELSGRHLLGPDGRITLPLVGSVRLKDLSRERAAKAITAKLSSFYMDLAVVVRVENYSSNRVLVLGRVAKPGEIYFGMTHPTLLEALSKAGGFDDASGLQGEAQSLPFTHCAVFRGRDKIMWIELEPLLTGKDLSLNLSLQRNDIVYVPDIEEKLVYVLGQVKNPGAFRLTPKMSFIELLARAGGPTIDAAPGRINMIRPTQGINQPIALNDLVAPNQDMNIALQEGDIIYVPTNTIAKINYAIQFLTPFSTMLGVYADIESIRADSQRRRLDQEKEALEAEKAALEAERAANSSLE